MRELRQYCPDSRIVALVDYSDKVGRLLDAGAALVYTRRVPPADVAAGISTLLAA